MEGVQRAAQCFSALLLRSCCAVTHLKGNDVLHVLGPRLTMSQRLLKNGASVHHALLRAAAAHEAGAELLHDERGVEQLGQGKE